MPINFDSALGVHEQALLLRAKRTEVLAANLANADTPNYKARDIDFKSILQQTHHEGQGPVRIAATDPRHIAPASGEDSPPIKYRVPHQPSADGNTVESHIEQAKFAENALRYQASFQFLDGRFKGIIKAIRGE